MPSNSFYPTESTSRATRTSSVIHIVPSSDDPYVQASQYYHTRNPETAPTSLTPLFIPSAPLLPHSLIHAPPSETAVAPREDRMLEDGPSTFGSGQGLEGIPSEEEDDIAWRDISVVERPDDVPPFTTDDTPHPEDQTEGAETDAITELQTQLSSLTRVLELHSDVLDELPPGRFDSYDRDLTVLFRRMSDRGQEISDVSFRVDEIEHARGVTQEAVQGLRDRMESMEQTLQATTITMRSQSQRITDLEAMLGAQVSLNREYQARIANLEEMIRMRQTIRELERRLGDTPRAP